jgi:hypothetical protein
MYTGQRACTAHHTARSPLAPTSRTGPREPASRPIERCEEAARRCAEPERAQGHGQARASANTDPAVAEARTGANRAAEARSPHARRAIRSAASPEVRATAKPRA